MRTGSMATIRRKDWERKSQNRAIYQAFLNMSAIVSERTAGPSDSHRWSWQRENQRNAIDLSASLSRAEMCSPLWWDDALANVITAVSGFRRCGMLNLTRIKRCEQHASTVKWMNTENMPFQKYNTASSSSVPSLSWSIHVEYGRNSTSAVSFQDSFSHMFTFIVWTCYIVHIHYL